MSTKDKINKITGITAIISFSIILIGMISNNQTILGFPNAMMLYLLMPSALIWFGTRKNGCGSCNQTSSSCSVTEQEKTKESNL